MAGVGGQRAVKRQHVSRRQQRLEVCLLYACRQLFPALAGHGLHLHAKSEGNLCHAVADVAKSDDTDGLACQFHEGEVPIAEVGTGGPSATAILYGIVLCTIRHHQQMGKHHLCDTFRTIGWYVGHDDAAFVGCLDVDHVIARCQHTYILKARQLGDLFTVDHDLVGQHDVCFSSSLYHLTRACAVVHRQLAHLLQLLPREVAGIS